MDVRCVHFFKLMVYGLPVNGKVGSRYPECFRLAFRKMPKRF